MIRFHFGLRIELFATKGVATKMITMIHSNVASVSGEEIVIDRKFHSGMLHYAEHLETKLTTIHPALSDGAIVMDPVRLAARSLPYELLSIQVNRHSLPLPGEIGRLEDCIARSKLVYGQDLGAADLARKHGVPYIMLSEYDLPTQIAMATSQISTPLRKLARTARCAIDYWSRQHTNFRQACAVHCNGYPIYDATATLNPNRLLYLDSRVETRSIIKNDMMQARLADRLARPTRLIFSGRFESVKGATDAVDVAVECQRLGLDIQMHFYGQGSQRTNMQRRAADARPGTIFIHDPIPFPELFEITKTFDLFVCCHTQADPSCTYIEAFGAGLPIAGYGNGMWKRLCGESKGGIDSPVHQSKQLASAIKKLIQNGRSLEQLTENARTFALAHSFETEMKKRIESLRTTYMNLSCG